MTIMNNGLNKNGEGYPDPTAWLAIRRVERSMNDMNEVYAGDIVSVRTSGGNEREFLALVVHDRAVTGYLLDEHNEGNMKKILSKDVMWYDPDLITYIRRSRITGFVKSVKEEEVDQIKKAVAETIWKGSMTEMPKDDKTFAKVIPATYKSDVYKKLIQVEAERDVYEKMYRELLGGYVSTVEK